MDTLIISVSKQGKGVNFALDYLSKEKLLQHFPEATFLSTTLQVPFGEEIKDSLEPYKEMVVQHIVPLLTGLSYEKLKQIHTLLFIQPSTEKVYLKAIQQPQNEFEQV
ncbi:MAG: hypothetical protein R3E32_28840 [Chitinophagales bacterium]